MTEEDTINTDYDRIRTRYIGIKTEIGKNPIISILRQTVILDKNGRERKLEDLNGPTIQFDENELIELRDKDTNELLGTKILSSEIMLWVRSWVTQQILKYENDQRRNMK